MPTVYAAAELGTSATLTGTPLRDTLYAAGSFDGTGDLTSTNGQLRTLLPAWSAGASADLSAFVATRGKARRTVVVELDGTQLGELQNAEQGAVTWSLNEWEEAEITLGIDDPKAALVLDEKFREVQLWRGDHLLMFGPVTGTRVDMTTLAADVSGPLWHLSRRHVGRSSRTNHLTNGDFTRGLTGWQTLRTAHFLTFAPTRKGWDTFIYEPGRNEGRALGIRQDARPWRTSEDRIDEDTIYVEVLSGDTLWGLARTYYGSGTQLLRILGANWAAIEADARAAGFWNPRNPAWYIKPGRTLAIPPVVASEAEEPDDMFRGWGAVVANQILEVEGGTRGVEVTVSGWCKVIGREFDSWATGGRGVVVQRFPTDFRTNNLWTREYGAWTNGWGGLRGLYTEGLEVDSSKLDEDHPFDIWHRHEATVFVPPGATELVVAQLEAANGLTVWDDVAVTFSEGLYWDRIDQAKIIGDLALHAQDPAFGKTYANIHWAGDSWLTGVRRSLDAPFDEHPNVWDLVSSFTELADGVDVSADITPDRRYIRVDYPRKGSTRPNIGLELGRNLASFAWAFQGDNASSAVIVLGDGDGSDREEASAIDPTAFAGGITLEEVFRAPEGTETVALGEVAAERLEVVKRPETLAVSTYPFGPELQRDLFGRVWVGDVVPVRIRRGVFGVTGDYRVVRLTLTPEDTFEMVLNLWETAG